MSDTTSQIVIEGDVAFVTGAASGFGLALSNELVSRGACVIMVDIDENGCKKAADELNAKTGKNVAIAVKADTTVFEEQLAAYELGKEVFGRVDYFFANAGLAERPWIPPFSPSTSSIHPITKPNLRTLDVDLNGQLNTAALALQVFERQEPNSRNGFRGKLVLTASVVGYYAVKSGPLYSAAKAGIVHFMRSAAEYYEDKGVTVNAISPNVTVTALTTQEILSLFNQEDLCSIDFVVEQMISVLGSCKDNGRAISITGKTVWDNPPDTHMRDQVWPVLSIGDDATGKAFGLWQ
ncbi:hypothetical protein D9758_011178 [Tetrapyrgos nigripes]|uniref:NAD(P)-binding protein n=1 Tax=Tetrapyrgos nigripes TaxID=182062 RepID=A0A8H5FZQ3_9AGAR|nr:hypothetical protein D9758_011178 [Tetrapyrgos nigripes]